MTVAAAHHDGRITDPHDLPVLARNAVLGLEWLAARAGFLRGMNDGMIFDGDVAYPISRVRKPFFRGIAKHRFDLGADVEPLAMDAEFRDVANGGDLLDQHAVFDFRFGAGTLGAHPFGDVAGHANPAAIGQGGNGHFRRDLRSVAVMHGQRPEPPAMFLQGFLNLRLYRGGIPGAGSLSP